ncbi:MAG: hypothetical protein ACR2PI_16120 [Hyphomicrobiaceae bacterium]
MTRPDNLMLMRISTAAIAAMICIGSAATSEAGRRNGSSHYKQVIAESRFGNGTVVGTVRQTRVGPQVQTPGGNWLYCERSCSETLRVNTVDFWENEQGGRDSAIDQEDGLLSRWLQWRGRY